jgi:hypothetical protein
MANPLVPLGTLNRLLGTVSVVNFPQLNVTAGYLGTEMISIAPDGPRSDYIDVQTGAVPSPRPYQKYTTMVHLLRSQGLAALWELQAGQSTSIGDFAVTPDSTTMPIYYFVNGVIMNVNEMAFNGAGDDYPLVLQGTYNINASLFT